ncbi:hypothetical protein [Mucilaginibacter agri]|uniref:Uncharacterized protein n=1 Tax=Mucilaginibacter agri TaxID=2695265 RepID=A0A965ZCC8_9SPHI|nr:hypothetical protein [Mucilaginibacter agri]NCD68418.1 hypothetical protein [Mucilaginibacter agri]
MAKSVITLCYRKIIDGSCTKPWDKLVFEASYMEFKMQAQNFSAGTSYNSYAQLLASVPNVNRLAGLVTPAITGYVSQLNNVMPDLLNNIGKRFIKFNDFQLEIINSDINDKAKHQIAVNFFSAPLIWHKTISNLLLVSEFNKEAQQEGGLTGSNLFQLQPYVNIVTISQL